MLCILFCLISINKFLRNKELTNSEHFFIRIPFAVYLGWITVATIANTVTFLVDLNWNRFSLSEVFWTITIVIIGAIIGFFVAIYIHSMAYGAVVIWAYVGILIKRLSPEEMDGQYISIIVVVITSILLLLAAEIRVCLDKKKNKK